MKTLLCFSPTCAPSLAPMPLLELMTTHCLLVPRGRYELDNDDADVYRLPYLDSGAPGFGEEREGEGKHREKGGKKGRADEVAFCLLLHALPRSLGLLTAHFHERLLVRNLSYFTTLHCRVCRLCWQSSTTPVNLLAFFSQPGTLNPAFRHCLLCIYSLARSGPQVQAPGCATAHSSRPVLVQVSDDVGRESDPVNITTRWTM